LTTTNTIPRIIAGIQADDQALCLVLSSNQAFLALLLVGVIIATSWSATLQATDKNSLAFPHPHLEPKNFYKHIMPDLPDPVRMRQLLSWCGHKLLSDPKGEGKKSPAEILGWLVNME
jgi:hypothetical protein